MGQILTKLSSHENSWTITGSKLSPTKMLDIDDNVIPPGGYSLPVTNLESEIKLDPDYYYQHYQYNDNRFLENKTSALTRIIEKFSPDVCQEDLCIFSRASHIPKLWMSSKVQQFKVNILDSVIKIISSELDVKDFVEEVILEKKDVYFALVYTMDPRPKSENVAIVKKLIKFESKEYNYIFCQGFMLGEEKPLVELSARNNRFFKIHCSRSN